MVSNHAMKIVIGLVLALSVGCAPRPVPVVAPRITLEALATRLAEADRLASRGCYLCLKEAAAAYASLLADSDDPVVAARALENNLMLAIREVELRMPDSGAREAAEQLQARVPVSYAPYAAALDLQENPLVVGGVTLQSFRAQREERLKFADALEKDAQASAMKAYFFIATVLPLRDFRELKPTIDGVLAGHPDDLSLKYRMLAFQPTYSGEAARDLIGQETGFGEVHLLMGQRAFLNGNLAGAFRELTRARELLPDSVSIAFALANITFAYARYADALGLYDRILASPAATGLEPQVRLGRAKSLSYLKRHDDGIAMLDELLLNDPSNNPGEKYYWRAWNRLQLGQAQLAYDDATTGLNAMRNDAIYRLAGMASFSLNRLGESRTFFEEALKMNRADCDSERYLGLLDSAERSWKPASSRFSVAASCYEAVILRLQVELSEYEKDITGLSNGLISAKRAEIKEADALRLQSAHNAAAASQNAK
jgi:tetratricopeptide (TPR) repeat protein